MKASACLTLVALGSALAQQPSASAPDGAVLIGNRDIYQGRVVIVRLTNGARIWQFSGQGDFQFATSGGWKTTGTRITVPAGPYDLHVMCEFIAPDKRSILAVPGVKAIVVDSGRTYQITGALSGNKKSCNLSISSAS